MSVINQMLKDLDQRQVEQVGVQNGRTHVAIPEKSVNKNFVAAIVVVILIINVVGLYTWNLYQENQSFKLASKKQSASDKISESKKDSVNNVNNITNQIGDKATITANTTVLAPTVSAPKVTPKKITNEKVQVVGPNSSNYKTSKVSAIAQTDTNIAKISNKVQESPDSKPIINKSAIYEDTVVTPIKYNALFNDSSNTPVPPKKSSLTISRRNLSPEKLVQQKIKAAERAILDNDVVKAELLFEEILLINPEHKSARKQLGALWYGRKLFKPAVNLLSRGIDIHPKDIDLRLMKARILLQQQNNQAAFNVLNGLSSAKHVEYQVLLANTAQLLKRNNSATLAYQQLVELEDYKGKWWLGYAVALDRNSEFDEAKSAYENALTKHDLSENSVQFIRQRLNELGEY